MHPDEKAALPEVSKFLDSLYAIILPQNLLVRYYLEVDGKEETKFYAEIINVISENSFLFFKLRFQKIGIPSLTSNCAYYQNNRRALGSVCRLWREGNGLAQSEWYKCAPFVGVLKFNSDDYSIRTPKRSSPLFLFYNGLILGYLNSWNEPDRPLHTQIAVSGTAGRFQTFAEQANAEFLEGIVG